MNINKRRSKFTNLHWTFLISGLLLIVTISIVYCYRLHLFQSGDLTAQIRNIVIAILGISGTPFLIFGHINRQKDIEIKRNDSLFKSESEVVGKVYRSLEFSISDFQKDISLVEMTVKYDDHVLKQDLFDWLGATIEKFELSEEKGFQKYCLNHIGKLEVWQHIKLTISSICSSLSIVRELQNEKLQILVLHRLSAGLSLNEMILLYFLTVISEIESKAISYSYKLEELEEAFETLVDLNMQPDDLEDAVDHLEKLIEKDNN